MGKSKSNKDSQLLNKHKKSSTLVEIQRSCCDGDANIHGFILKTSKKYMLIQKAEEFQLNGYTIIRRDQYDAIRNNDYDKTYKTILKKEGVLKKHLGLNHKITLNSWSSVFQDLKKLKKSIIVECENIKKSSFVIGPIAEVKSKSVLIKYFDPNGVLDSKPTRVQYKDITLVSFGDRYNEVFSKYLKKA